MFENEIDHLRGIAETAQCGAILVSVAEKLSILPKHWHISWVFGSDRTDYRLYRRTVQRIVCFYTDDGEFDRYLLLPNNPNMSLSTPKSSLAHLHVC